MLAAERHNHGLLVTQRFPNELAYYVDDSSISINNTTACDVTQN